MQPAKAPLLPKLRGYFAEFLNQGSLKRLSILYSSTRVGLQYEHQTNSLRGFSRKRGISQFGPPCGFPPRHFSALNGKADLPALPAYGLKPGHPSPGWPTLLRHPFAQTRAWWYRNINLFSITYAFRPRLRSRLTLGGLTFPRKP